jgi:hypothetical protein
MTPAPIRIDVWRGIKAVLLTLVVPTSLAVMVDMTTGTLPWLTIAAAIICIPLATIVVNRAMLAEFDRVVALVAPEEADAQADSEETEPAASTAESDPISNDGPLAGQSLTEGAQKHHG